MKRLDIKKCVCAATLIGAAMLVIPTNVQAQEFSVAGDLVSSYIWRGSYCGGVSVQPTLGFSAGGFSLTAWGSVGFTSPDYLEEFDFTAGYSVGNLSLAITDYWFVYRTDDPGDYFNYKAKETAHMFEGTLGYDFGPLALSWNTFFAGNDFKVNDDGEDKRAYSTYIEASAPFKVGEIDLKAELGVTPWEGLYADKFYVVNIGLTGSKEIKITDSFSFPAFAKVIFNPAAKQTHFVFGISL